MLLALPTHDPTCMLTIGLVSRRHTARGMAAIEMRLHQSSAGCDCIKAARTSRPRLFTPVPHLHATGGAADLADAALLLCDATRDCKAAAIVVFGA